MTHSYNPCTSIVFCNGEYIGEVGEDVAICVSLPDSNHSRKLYGRQSSARFESSSFDDMISIEYSNDVTQYEVTVRLICDPNELFGRFEIMRWGDFHLHTSYACAPHPQTTKYVRSTTPKYVVQTYVMTAGYVIAAVLIAVWAILVLGIVVLCVMLCTPKTGASTIAESRTSDTSGGYGQGWQPPQIITTHTPAQATARAQGAANASTSSRQQPASTTQRGPLVVNTPHPADRNTPTPGHAVPHVPLGFAFTPPSYDTVLMLKELETRPPGAYMVTLSQPSNSSLEAN